MNFGRSIRMTINARNTISAIAALAGLVLAVCNSKSNDMNGQQKEKPPDPSVVTQETEEAPRTTGELAVTKTEEV